MIYTTRIININGSTATIDEDIYLFKQDSNIELKFIINDTRFTFQTVESSNVIESSNAYYFRVKLLNPYGKTINFPIQEVTDNYIVLLITGELIDEDTEVGDYTIQIRLYDKDKNSKLTLPAIANCIHIQQPIFSEIEENTVDTAAIDTASVMMSDEGELPVVDSTGKYIPTLWDTGDTISKAKINHIEKGILQAHTDALGTKIPQITPPKRQDTSDIITVYNELPERGLVYFTNSYYISDAFIIGLCYIDPYTDNNKPAKTIICTSTAMYVNITSTGDISGTGVANNDLDKFITEVLKNPNRKAGQVLTMLNNVDYGWADTTPELYIHNITDSDQVELTLDPYQLISITDATPQALSPKYTVDILTPNIEESDNHVYKIHVMFMADPKIVYLMPSGMYDHPPTELTDGIIYEFIFTYVKPYWLIHCNEYSHEVSSEPQ